MHVHGQTLASISHSCNSRAHTSNSRAKALRGLYERSQVAINLRALLQILRGSCERSRFNVNLLASCTVANIS